MTAHTTAKPKPKKRGRPAQYDWDSIRREYFKGGDEVTYQSLSVGIGKPSYDRIKARAAAENWAGLRADFRHHVESKTREVQLEALSVVKARQCKMARLMQQIAMEAIEQIDPASISINAAIRLMVAGCEIERKALQMREYTVNLNDINSPEDLRKLTLEQLFELKQRRREALGPHTLN